MQRSTNKKEERLKSRKLIEELFSKGKSLSHYPLRVLFAEVSEQPVLQAGVSVSSKKFKKAVDRNRIKRLMREAYRHQKFVLQTQLALLDQHVVVFFIYTGKELPEYAGIYASMGEILKKLTDLLALNIKR